MGQQLMVASALGGLHDPVIDEGHPWRNPCACPLGAGWKSRCQAKMAGVAASDWIELRVDKCAVCKMWWTIQCVQVCRVLCINKLVIHTTQTTQCVLTQRMSLPYPYLHPIYFSGGSMLLVRRSLFWYMLPRLCPFQMFPCSWLLCWPPDWW